MSQTANTRLVKSLAKQFGFDFCGIAAAKELTEDARRLEQWLSNGFQGEMQYMENHFDLRIDPRKLVPGAKSVITFLKNYCPSPQDEAIHDNSDLKIAKYAWGEDYHEVIREQLHQILALLQKQIGNVIGRGFVDSA
ncbi:MAG: epoxyqueuosine reductase, partial [Sediminibacterium sp.]